ncbi:hypothetical protein TNIN_62161 [Trichonephila inaurata madagascariensis]|uniref:Uncharacterized protein n=1 Tax=Trichonephila inaurata madagascariensis TaxID=2747483 RepID=A0A8X7BQ96_9ARAC|nr:hypothetical protein TNIN_62161 [Trichonephila inaurata madagascariensis]
MEARCSPCQIAEAVVLWGNRIICSQLYENFRDVSTSKCLDAILVTVEHFIRAFEEDFDEIMNAHCTHYMSRKDFVDFILSRCMTLSEENHHANFILTCAFTSRVIFLFHIHFSCFHRTQLASKCLSTVLSEKFGEVFASQMFWKGLVKFCKQVNKDAFFVMNWGLDDFSGFSSDYSDDSSEQTTSEEFENCSSIEIASSNKLAWDEELSANVPKIKKKRPNSVISNEWKHSKKCKNGFQYSLYEFVAESDSPKDLSIESRQNNPKFRNIIVNDAESLSKIRSLIDKCKNSIDVEQFLTDCSDLGGKKANLNPETNFDWVETAGTSIDSSHFCYVCQISKYNSYFVKFSTRYVNEYPNVDLVSDIVLEFKEKV